MEKNKLWQISNNCLFLCDVTGTQEKLENVVYTLQCTDKGILYLQKLCDKFAFDFKVYGMETGFIKRFIKTYNNTKGNLGALLNGVKGTGKTITAEILANDLNLPVIIIGENYPGINDFLASVPQDITILVDEYEKVFVGKISEDDYNYDEDGSAKGNSTLLSIMDGVYKTEFRKVFLLTTNKTWINENMINRPGRIRYLKQFDDLNLEQIKEIVDDCLVETQFRDEIMSYLKPLEIITVDIVKSIINEVNIHQEGPGTCCKDFNLKFKNEEFSVFALDANNNEVNLMDEHVSQKTFQAVMNPEMGWQNRYLYVDGDYYYIQKKPDYENLIFNVKKTNVGDAFNIRIKKEVATHKSFVF